ncbi:MAG: GNAT family N-acetyltransferase [Hamadaea sp.]|nr:GNAT family N-acetyltransferase [Hamadaea sp.]
MSADELTVAEVDADRWDDLVTLFGPSGAYSGCWCMWWRLSGKEFGANGNPGNRAALEQIVAHGRPAGLLAYQANVPVGWASVAPRPDFPRLSRSRTLGLDRDADPEVWSVPCFFIARRHRGAGVATALLRAAVDHVRDQGGRVLEGYPTDVGEERKPSADLFTGTPSLFAKAGFTVHARPSSGRRLVVRRDLS